MMPTSFADLISVFSFAAVNFVVLIGSNFQDEFMDTLFEFFACHAEAPIDDFTFVARMYLIEFNQYVTLINNHIGIVDATEVPSRIST